MDFPCKENENSLRQHCLKFQVAPLCTTWDHLNKYLIGLSQKNSFRALEKWKIYFPWKENENSLSSIVWNSKMHPCAQYEVIGTNYAMNVALRLIIWLESHESSRMITLFWEQFFKIISILQVYYFSWKLGHI